MDKESRFKEIIEANKDRIFRICCGYVQDREERKDVYQEVLVNIWRSLETFRNQSSPGTWVYRIAVNTCLGHLRSDQRRKRPLDPEASAHIDLLPEEHENGTEEGLQDSIDRLYRCIAALPPIDRAIVTLYLEEVGTQEIAETLGISEVNVRVKFHRIRKVLRPLLKEGTYGT